MLRVHHPGTRDRTGRTHCGFRHSRALTAHSVPLIFAWDDFEGDVRSVVNDLIRNPSRVDTEGMQLRMEALEELLNGSVLELPAAEWEEFTLAFQTLLEVVSGSSDRT